MTPEISKLCRRLALEETRQAGWTRARELRAHCAEKLKQEPPELVEKWLHQLIESACARNGAREATKESE